MQSLTSYGELRGASNMLKGPLAPPETWKKSFLQGLKQRAIRMASDIAILPSPARIRSGTQRVTHYVCGEQPWY